VHNNRIQIRAEYLYFTGDALLIVFNFHSLSIAMKSGLAFPLFDILENIIVICAVTWSDRLPGPRKVQSV